jgi:hypothetical protein
MQYTLEQKKRPLMSSTDFTLEHLFGSRTRARLLALFFSHENERFYVRELTRRVDAHVHAVRRELANLVQIGVLAEVDIKNVDASPKEKKEEESDQRKYYALNTAFPLYNELQSLMRKMGVLLHHALGRVLRAIPGVERVVLCGACLGKEGAVLDILIVGQCLPEDVRKAVDACEKEIGRELNFSCLTTEDFTYRRSVGDRFLNNIFGGDHVVVIDVAKT